MKKRFLVLAMICSFAATGVMGCGAKDTGDTAETTVAETVIAEETVEEAETENEEIAEDIGYTYADFEECVFDENFNDCLVGVIKGDNTIMVATNSENEQGIYVAHGSADFEIDMTSGGDAYLSTADGTLYYVDINKIDGAITTEWAEKLGEISTISNELISQVDTEKLSSVAEEDVTFRKDGNYITFEFVNNEDSFSGLINPESNSILLLNVWTSAGVEISIDTTMDFEISTDYTAEADDSLFKDMIALYQEVIDAFRES